MTKENEEKNKNKNNKIWQKKMMKKWNYIHFGFFQQEFENSNDRNNTVDTKDMS